MDMILATVAGKVRGRVEGGIATFLGIPYAAAPFGEFRFRAPAPVPAWVGVRDALAFGPNAFSIVVDGDVVPSEPLAAVRAGAAADVDLLLGYNSEEYRLWFVPSRVIDRVNAITLRLALAKFRIKPRVAKEYRRDRPTAKPGEILGAIATDMLLRVPANRLADERRGDNTFMYEFGWPSPVDGLGACHALEIGFVFDTLRSPDVAALAGPAAPQVLADAMHRAWVDFAATGKPGWTSWDLSRPVMRFDLPAPVLVHAPHDTELSQWP